MPTFLAPDGTRLAYRLVGDAVGDPVLCVPGGPMRASRYLRDLGGLGARRRLAVLDLRGTGDSEVPADPSTYRCDRLVADVEALRAHLGLDRADVLAHSTGAGVAIQHAIGHPDRVGRMVLVTPSTHAVGLSVSDDVHREVAALRSDEPWYTAARAALEALLAGTADAAALEAFSPLGYGRWDDDARRHDAGADEEINAEARARYASDGAVDPEAVRAALRDLRLDVLVIAGELDVVTPPPLAAALVDLVPGGRRVVFEGAGHYPWLDDGVRFADVVGGFLASSGAAADDQR